MFKKELRHIQIKKNYSNEMKRAIIKEQTKGFIENSMPENTTDVIISLTYISEGAKSEK